MYKVLPCLVDKLAKVYFKDGIHSHSAIAHEFKINEDKVLKYGYDLEARALVSNFNLETVPFVPKQSHNQIAMEHFNKIVGTHSTTQKIISTKFI